MCKRLIASVVCFTFIFSNFQYSQAQIASLSGGTASPSGPATGGAGGDFSINQLPVPGTMVGESAPFVPLSLKGLIVNPQKPLEFQFIVDTGSDVSLRGAQATKQSLQEQLKQQINQLVKYFLAGLTIPEGDLWVNLSPYEKDRMIPEALGQTDLGRDLLAQDYILKQLTASLIYPEKDLGREFWSRVYKQAQKQFGTTDVPVSTFNKVWILPNQAQVFENGNAAYVTKSTLKVMLDEDYLALQKHSLPLAGGVRGGGNDVHTVASQIVRTIILPEIEKEVNTGKNFAPLRQIYQALILAKWYKETIQNGLFDAVYTDKNKIAGVNLDDPAIKEQIYNRYLQAYKKGAFNFIKEDPTPDGQVVPRKYFSGGITQMGTFTLEKTHDEAMFSANFLRGGALGLILVLCVLGKEATPPGSSRVSYQQGIKPTIVMPLLAKQDDLFNKIVYGDFSSQEKVKFYRDLIDSLGRQNIPKLNELILTAITNEILDSANKLAEDHDGRIQRKWAAYRALLIVMGKDADAYLSVMSRNMRYDVSEDAKEALQRFISGTILDIRKKGETGNTLSQLQTPKQEKPDAAMAAKVSLAPLREVNPYFPNDHKRYLENVHQGKRPDALSHLDYNLPWPVKMDETGYIWQYDKQEFMMMGIIGSTNYGLNILVKRDTKVRAIADGVVVTPAIEPGIYLVNRHTMVTNVYVRSPSGLVVRYGYLGLDDHVQVEDRIKAGDVIGTAHYIRGDAPDSFRSTKGTPVDPALYEYNSNANKLLLGGNSPFYQFQLDTFFVEPGEPMPSSNHLHKTSFNPLLILQPLYSIPNNASAQSQKSTKDAAMIEQPLFVSMEAVQEAKAKPDLAMVTEFKLTFFAGLTSAGILAAWWYIKQRIIEDMVSKSLKIYSNLNKVGRINWAETLIKWIDKPPSLYLSSESNYVPYQMPNYAIFNTNLLIKVIQALLLNFMIADADAGIYTTILSIDLAFQKGTLTSKSKEVLKETLKAAVQTFTERQKDPILAPRADRALVWIEKIQQGNDAAMLGEVKIPAWSWFLKGKAAKARDLGGIDLNKINILRNGKTVNVQFDPVQLDELTQGGFEGFTPVIIDITHIPSPFQLLGINPAKEPELLSKT